MTTIKASCPSCGEVELTGPDIQLMVCTNHDPRSYYQFVCTRCMEIVRKPADHHVVELLLSGGVVKQTWTIPAEALEPRAGAVINMDDILDLCIALGEESRAVKLIEEES